MGSNQHSRKRSAFFRVLSLILLDRRARRIFPSSPPISMGGPSGLRDNPHIDASKALHVHRVSSCDERRATINILPDDVLLHTFDFVRLIPLEVRQDRVGRVRMSWWHHLIHVCQRWRAVVFASPKYLDLKLVCGPTTRVENLGIWPPLPIIIKNRFNWHMPDDYGFDAAITHPVCEISLFDLTSSQLQRLASAMQEPFPALIHLRLDLDSYSRPAPALPDGFLGGSAPNLQSLCLSCIPFPALPKLLPSATHLVCLSLRSIPSSGYISPEAIIAGLSMLANLKSLTIEFGSPSSRPGRESRIPPMPTRTVLPALTRFEFEGVSEYLEDFVTRIDAPLLGYFSITFIHQFIFDIPELAQFVRRTTRLQGLDEAHLHLTHYGIQVESLPLTGTFVEMTVLSISCRKLDWQLPSLAPVLTSLFPFIHMVEHLYIYGSRMPSQRQGENTEWRESFRPFSLVRNLYVSKDVAQRISPALQYSLDALPALEILFVEKLQPSAFEQFIATRQLLGHPVAVSHWNRA